MARESNGGWKRPPVPSIDPSGLAIAALQFLAGEADRIGGFLAETGINPTALRGQIGDAAFQAGLLDYLLAREPLLLEFCRFQQIDPLALAPARDALMAGSGFARRHDEGM